MSWCCQGEEPQYKYEVKSLAQNGEGPQRETYRYYNSLEDVDHLVKENENVSITKVKTQIGFTDLKANIQKKGEKYTDELFPPNSKSLGNIPGNISWKRIKDLLPREPVLFDNKIEPSDVITGHQGDCYMLSSLAALAESPDIIRRIFRGQSYNESGLYKVSLRIDGAVEEVVIDDYIPVHQNGQPVFTQPNRKTGQIWVVLLQKALAKVSGSYANLNEGIPSQIFRQVTYAPSESLVFSEESEDKQKVWHLLKEQTANHYPFCATTKEEAAQSQGLQKSHTYTVVSAVEVEGQQGIARIVKLRNPWKEVNYRGIAALNDHDFWESIHESQVKTNTRSQSNNNCSYGLFTMRFEDFCRNFNQIHYCNLNNGGKFLSENLVLSNKACFFDVSVQRQGSYTFEINQAKIMHHPPQQQQQPHVQQQIQSYHVEPQHTHEHQNIPHIHEQVHQYINPHETEREPHTYNQEHQYHHNHEEHYQGEPSHFPQEHFHPEKQSAHAPVQSYHPPNVHHEHAEYHPVGGPGAANYNNDHGASNHAHDHATTGNSNHGPCRSTILIIRKEKTEHGFRFQLVNGTMKYETNTTLTEELPPGDYVVYAKVDPQYETNKLPPSATLNLYSKNFATLTAVLRTKYPHLVEDALLDHAFHNKRSEYSEGKVWMSWQLFFQKGGYAYLAGGNSLDSQQTVAITYDEQDFKKLDFKLKKPLKGSQGKRTLHIQPGEAKIIVARVINNPNTKSVRFPPKLDIKLEPYHP